MNILCYHAVEDGWDAPLAVTPAAFEQQCSWLSRSARVVPLAIAVEELRGWSRLPRKTTAITFDDAYESVYTNAFPILERYNLPATVFTIAETLTAEGRDADWVDSPPPRPVRTLSLDQILEMRDAGVDFESHSYSHFDLTTLSEAECEQDLRSSREMLEGLLGHPVPFLAYPRGRHNEAVRRAAECAGYTHAFTLPETHEPLGPYSIPRVGLHLGNGTRSIAIKTKHLYLAMRMSRMYPLLQSVGRRVG
jgi:peptidoglycan/xylan/chitin deacetylase (PgdA/CDA1 family)